MHNILIVHNSSTIRKVAEIAFRFEPFSLHMAEGIKSAEPIIAEVELDAALINVGLPGEDAANLCQTLHSKFGDRLRIILLSPNDAPLNPKQLEELHALAQIAKPFQTQVLIDQTRKNLGLKIEKSVATIRFGAVAQAPDPLGPPVFVEEQVSSVTAPLATETIELSLADIQKGSSIIAPSTTPPTPITVPELLTPKVIYSPPPPAPLVKGSDTEWTEASVSEALGEDNNNIELSPPPIVSQQYTEQLTDTLGDAEIGRETQTTASAPNLNDVDIDEDITNFQTQDGEGVEGAEETPDSPQEETNIPFAPPPISATEYSDEKPLTLATAATTPDSPDDNARLPFAPAPGLPTNESRGEAQTAEKLTPFDPITDLTCDLLTREFELSHDHPLLPELDEEQLMPLVEAAVKKIAQESIESVVWEVVPQICELIIRERLSEINPGLDSLR
ncbi:MAG: response regulator [Myxococcota bacterium]|nr:response regulator [Myxococcota bacterium]